MNVGAPEDCAAGAIWRMFGGMGKPTWLAILAVAALVAGYLVAVRLIGAEVEGEMQRLAATLAARDDIELARFDYQRGLQGGTLHYDLAWLPPDGAPGRQAAGLLPPEGLRITGELRVRHGPWAGRGAGLALAGTEGDIPLPDALHPYLPEYSGQAPVLRVTARITLAGSLEIRMAGQEYRGRILDPEAGEVAQVELAGLAGRLRTSSRLDQFVVDLSLPEFSLTAGDTGDVFEINLRGLHVGLEAFEARPLLWTGTGSVEWKHMVLRHTDGHFEIRNVLATSDTWIEEPMLHSRFSLAAGPVEFDGQVLPGGTLAVTWRNLDADALSGLAQLMERAQRRDRGEAAEPDGAQATALIDQILAGRPSLTIEPLSVSLAAPGDIEGRLVLGFDGDARLSLDRPEEFAHAVRLDAGLAVRLGALRQMAALIAAEHIPPGATEDERDAQVDATYREMLAGFEALPFLTVDDTRVALAAEIREGRVFVGGNEVLDVETLLGLIQSALAGAFAEVDAGSLNPRAEPAYGRVSLGADFAPDPFAIQVVAGGEHDLNALVGGGCVGWVNGERPDFVLHYDAGEYPLYIYATAEFDTTLAVLDPRGRWHCSDDAPGRGLDPGVELLDPASGEYIIWLGAFGSGATAAWLFVSEAGLRD